MSRPPEHGLARLGDGVELAYSIIGPQQPAAAGSPRDELPLLLHRPLGGSMALWGEFRRRLATTYRVIAFDPQGVGRSSDVPFFYSTREMARDAVGLLDYLGVEQAHVFGLSLGGMVASYMALDAPRRVGRLVLASTLPRQAAISARALGRGLRLLRCLTKVGVQAEVCLVMRILSAQFRSDHPERLREIGQLVREVPARRRNLLALALSAARHNIEPELQGLATQTLLLFGELDPIAGQASQAELLHALPRSRLEVLARSGHDLSLEQPRTTAERVLSFLRDGV